MIFFFFLVAIVVDAQPIWECDFEGSIEECFTGRNSTHNMTCQIVPCTNVQNITHCLQVRNRTFDGDCFSKVIQHNVTFSDPNDVLVAEFKFMPIRHPFNQIYSSGGFIGYEEYKNSYTPIYWVALSKTPQPLKETIITKFSLELIDIKNQWTSVRLIIHPETNQVRFVIQDYIESLGATGDFLIDNFTVYHKELCSVNCKVCNTYDNCLACDEGFMLWRGSCISSICQTNIPKLTQDKYSIQYDLQKSLFEIQIREAVFDCYGFVLKVNGNKIDFNIIGQNLTFLFNKSMIVTCPFNQALLQYECISSLIILIRSTKIQMSSVTWQTNFQVDLNVFAVNDVGTKVNSYSLTPINGKVIITVKGDAKVCSDSSCLTFLTNPKIIIGQEFYILLSINSTDFRQMYTLNLTQAYLMGNGTMIQIDIDQQKRKNTSQGVIYALTVPLVVYKGYLALSADLIELKTSRLLQEISNDQSTKSYVVASLIQFEVQLKLVEIIKNLIFIVIFSVVGGIILAILIGLGIKLCRNGRNI